MISLSNDLDSVDLQILGSLMVRGRATWTDLAEEVGLSSPAVTERVRKLEAQGVVRGFAASVDPQAVGLGMLAFVSVAVRSAEAHRVLLDWVRAEDAVLECHVVAGEYDYLLKVRCRDAADLERLLREELRRLEGIDRTFSTVVLTSWKETSRLPLPDVLCPP